MVESNGAQGTSIERKLVMFKRWLSYLCNERGGGGGGGGTTTVTTPGPTADEIALQQQQLELVRQQMEEARQQSAMYNRFGDLFEKQTQQQAQLAQQQIDAQKSAMEQMSKALAPTEQEKLNQQIEGELLQRQQGYVAGNMPTLSAEQSSQLNELTGIQKQLAAQNILAEQKKGMGAARNTAVARGLGSSSVRENLEDTVRQFGIQQAGEAVRGIENAKFEAAWQLPRAQQILGTQQSQFQQSLQQQAQANRQQVYSSLANVGNINPFPAQGSFMNWQVPGTYFAGGTQ